MKRQSDYALFTGGENFRYDFACSNIVWKVANWYVTSAINNMKRMFYVEMNENKKAKVWHVEVL